MGWQLQSAFFEQQPLTFTKATMSIRTSRTQSRHSAHSGPLPLGGINHGSRDPLGHNRGWFAGEVRRTVIPADCTFSMKLYLSGSGCSAWGQPGVVPSCDLDRPERSGPEPEPGVSAIVSLTALVGWFAIPTPVLITSLCSACTVAIQVPLQVHIGSSDLISQSTRPRCMRLIPNLPIC